MRLVLRPEVRTELRRAALWFRPAALGIGRRVRRRSFGRPRPDCRRPGILSAMAGHARPRPDDSQGDHPPIPVALAARKARAAPARPCGCPRQAPATLLAHLARARDRVQGLDENPTAHRLDTTGPARPFTIPHARHARACVRYLHGRRPSNRRSEEGCRAADNLEDQSVRAPRQRSFSPGSRRFPSAASTSPGCPAGIATPRPVRW